MTRRVKEEIKEMIEKDSIMEFKRKRQYKMRRLWKWTQMAFCLSVSFLLFFSTTVIMSAGSSAALICLMFAIMFFLFAVLLIFEK